MAAHNRVNNAAFNAGCDARLAGERLSTNPYKPKLGSADYQEAYRAYKDWRNGWFHVHDKWCSALPEELRRPLPEVQMTYEEMIGHLSATGQLDEYIDRADGTGK
jgi:hypothetical protein